MRRNSRRRYNCNSVFTVASTLEAEEFEEYEIPASTWAVFAGEGKSVSIQDLERRIVMD